MKLKKSTLLLIALFSVSVEFIHAQPFSSDSSSSDSSSSSEDWKERGAGGPPSENEDKDPGNVSNGEKKVAALSSSGGSSILSSDSENDLTRSSAVPLSTSEDEGEEVVVNSRLVDQETFHSTNPFVVPSDDENDYSCSSPVSQDGQGHFTDPFNLLPQKYSNSDQEDSQLLSHMAMATNRILASKRKNSGFSKIVGPVAAIVVIGYILRKLFSGSKKPRNQRRVRPDQRPAGTFNNKTTYHYSAEGDQRPAGSY